MERCKAVVVLFAVISTLGIIITWLHGGAMESYIKPYPHPKPQLIPRNVSSTSSSNRKDNLDRYNQIAMINIIEPELIPQNQNGGLKCGTIYANIQLCLPKDEDINKFDMVGDRVWQVITNMLDGDSTLGLIDLGAGYGKYTVAVASEGREVLAVEQEGMRVAALCQSLRLTKLSGKVRIVRTFVSPSRASLSSESSKNGMQDNKTLPSIVLDDIWPVVLFDRAVLRIDSRLSVLKTLHSGHRMLRKVKFILLDWLPTATSLVDYMNVVFILSRNGYIPYSFAWRKLANTKKNDLLNWPREMVWKKEKQLKPLTRAYVGHALKVGLSPGFCINILDPKLIPSGTDSTICVPLKTAKNKLICLDTMDDSIGHLIRMTGSWEGPIWNTVSAFLHLTPEAGLIDIGANTGVYTLSAAAMGRRVVAVEAFYENVQRLCESIRLNGMSDLVTMVHNAVSDVYERVSFIKTKSNPSDAHTVSDKKSLSSHDRNFVFFGEHDHITSVTIDDLRHITPFKKAVLKIDIEGYERKALRRVHKLFARVDVVGVFTEWGIMRKNETDAHLLVNLFRKLGYQPFNVRNLKPLRGVKYDEIVKWPWDIGWAKEDYLAKVRSTLGHGR